LPPLTRQQPNRVKLPRRTNFRDLALTPTQICNT
jgi:hypothetical protein